MSGVVNTAGADFGACPKCKIGALQLRQTGRGYWIGCSNHCRFKRELHDHIERMGRHIARGGNGKVAELETTISDLRAMVMELQNRLAAALADRGTSSGGGSVDAARRKLRDVIGQFHPDKHPTGNVSATDVTAALNALRDSL